jgi:hypothetical protein
MPHTCHAYGCVVRVPPALFMCKPHWFSLRKPLRDAIWRMYRPGQEDDKKPSASYMAVQRRAVGELAFKTNREISVRLMLESEKWAAVALLNGECDPLDGLRAHPLSLELQEAVDALARAEKAQ